ncbi:MAG: carbamoyl-phosphate synthase small subunit, partial [Proteobacteria bacterium]
MTESTKKAFLVLETGESYQGKWHCGTDRAGEVVFNTSHSGYEEIATDPSYYHQIVVLTAPMQGNYGADQQSWESHKLWIEGFVSLQMQETEREKSWVQRLHDHKIPLVTEIDTRELVMRLRSGGTPWGALVQAQTESEAQAKAQKLIAEKRKGDT